jgi:hypothetical protein
MDTEYVPRKGSEEERAQKKDAKIAFHRKRFAVDGFTVDWAEIGTCTVQIAHGLKVLIADIKKMKGESQHTANG